MNTKFLLIILAVLIAGAILWYAVPLISPVDIRQEIPQEKQQHKEEPTSSKESTPTKPSAPPEPSVPVSPKTPKNTPPQTQPPTQKSTQSQKTGRLVLAITDDTIPVSDINSVFVSITNIAAQKTGSGWITISNELRTYDLLKLKREAKLELMFDTTIPEGTYTQLRLTISSVVIVKNGLANTAKLPSGTMYLPLSLPLRSGQTASITLDFTADKSIHTTNANQFIFAPVMHVNVLGEIQTVQESGSKVEFFGGLPKFASSFGMDETGAMKQNSMGIDSLSTIEIERGIFVLIPHSINRSLFQITPVAAMDAATSSAYLTHISSVYATMAESKPMWRVYGALNGRATSIYVDGVSGIVSKIE